MNLVRAALAAAVVALALVVGNSPVGVSPGAPAQQADAAVRSVRAPADAPTPTDGSTPTGTPTGTPTPADPTAQAPDLDSGAPDQSQAHKVNCRVKKCIALTFDDGPVRQTAKLLTQLKARGAHATFFVLGNMARQRPGILRRMAAEGNAIGNHSWNHPKFFEMSTAAVRKQIAKTDAVIRKATGKNPALMRPPYGQQDGRIRKAIRGFGDPVILWSMDTMDWKYRNTKRVTKYVVSHARRNTIVLMHDIRPTTRAAVPGIIDRLQAKGFTLVTVPELFGGRLRPGHAYTHA